MELLISLVIFSLVTSITPGPNNMMLMTSGLNHGARRSLPHFLGINIGFAVMITVVGLGLGALFRHYPFIHDLIRVLGSAYLLFLAWKIANAGNPKASGSLGEPFSFLQACAFQWVNPKAWVIAVGAIAMFASGQNVAYELALVVAAYMLVGGASMAAWLFLGVALTRFVNDERRIRYFNFTMAALLVMSILSVLPGSW